MAYDVDDTLAAISQLNFTGNIIPHSWYQHITFETGKPDLLGIMVLADMVYWYRPTEIRDPNSGQVTGHQKKFHSDMLQRNLGHYAEFFGVSKRQIADALKRLENLGLILREFRTIEVSNRKINNVLFIAPIAEALARIQKPTKILPPPDDDSGFPFDDYFAAPSYYKFAKKSQTQILPSTKKILVNSQQKLEEFLARSWPNPKFRKMTNAGIDARIDVEKIVKIV